MALRSMLDKRLAVPLIHPCTVVLRHLCYVFCDMYVGSWLSINGEAIYKTKPWQHQNDTLNNNFWYVKYFH